jgi:superfamily II DNA or RNA helicase
MIPATATIQLLRRTLSPKQVARATELHRQNRVQLVESAEDDVEAEITGFVIEKSGKFQPPIMLAVRFQANGGDPEVVCSCQARRCAHALALLLEYEDRRRDEASTGMPAPSSTGRPKLKVLAGGLSADARHLPDPTPAPPKHLTTHSRRTTPLHFAIDADRTRRQKALVVMALEHTTIDGEDALRTPLQRRWPKHLDPSDRKAIDLLSRVGDAQEIWGSWSVPDDELDTLLPLLTQQGRLFVVPTADRANTPIRPVRIDAGPPFTVATVGTWSDEHFTLHAELRRGGEVLRRIDVGFGNRAIVDDRLLHLDVGAGARFVHHLLTGPGSALAIRVAREQAPEVVDQVMNVVAADPSILPPVATEIVRPETTVLLVHLKKTMGRLVPCDLAFVYGERTLTFDDPLLIPPVDPRDPWLQRDEDAEDTMFEAFQEAHGAHFEETGIEACYLLPQRQLLGVLTLLVRQGQRVLADGKPMLPVEREFVFVSSGIDWFDVKGELQFAGGRTLPLAKALLAARRGQGLVELGDGRTGVLPDDLLARWQPVLTLGDEHGDDDAPSIRLRRSQALLLDALLAARGTEVHADRDFASLQTKLRSFTGIAARPAPAGFAGTLRDYQQQGLGWLWFLRELGLGGCLADDMGLGKTVQVLALLLGVHGGNDEGNGADPQRSPRRPSLLVAPRSLLDNWRNEAQRFTPSLRVLDFSGPDRWAQDPGEFAGHDLVLTTYGTLRSDIERFEERGQHFEYAILDEAQAVENASSVTSKAVRLLRAEHRLALTGTPIQNHLGELWALFEFLTPGLLGKSKAFQQLVKLGTGRRKKDADGEPTPDRASATPDLQALRHAIAPFLLRRTKEHVLRELPAKQEQTLSCVLDPRQRRAYDALREHYREELLNGAADLDNTERFKVLEALLRLRQAACHEGLVDPTRKKLPSAKLDNLVPMLAEIHETGHKALVFSQFTQFLGIVREHLDARGVDYEYLDGRTKKRQEKVDRFQQDPTCSVFLISLKAGGFGLNLTAADYVFLLDPWWNPAAEAQAVDRAHRIGQTKKVAVYRLVARDTVEEKVLDLQRDKRALADALLADNASLLAGLDRAQLAALLS